MKKLLALAAVAIAVTFSSVPSADAYWYRYHYWRHYNYYHHYHYYRPYYRHYYYRPYFHPFWW